MNEEQLEMVLGFLARHVAERCQELRKKKYPLVDAIAKDLEEAYWEFITSLRSAEAVKKFPKRPE